MTSPFDLRATGRGLKRQLQWLNPYEPFPFLSIKKDRAVLFIGESSIIRAVHTCFAFIDDY